MKKRINTRRKGNRGHQKAVAWFKSQGIQAEAWPHTKGGHDLFGFADVIGVDCNGDAWFAQVKNTKERPSNADWIEFVKAVIGSQCPASRCFFLWFKPRQKAPEVWVIPA